MIINGSTILWGQDPSLLNGVNTPEAEEIYTLEYRNIQFTLYEYKETYGFGWRCLAKIVQIFSLTILGRIFPSIQDWSRGFKVRQDWVPPLGEAKVFSIHALNLNRQAERQEKKPRTSPLPPLPEDTPSIDNYYFISYVVLCEKKNFSVEEKIALIEKHYAQAENKEEEIGELWNGIKYFEAIRKALPNPFKERLADWFDLHSSTLTATDLNLWYKHADTPEDELARIELALLDHPDRVSLIPNLSNELNKIVLVDHANFYDELDFYGEYKFAKRINNRFEAIKNPEEDAQFLNAFLPEKDPGGHIFKALSPKAKQAIYHSQGRMFYPGSALSLKRASLSECVDYLERELTIGRKEEQQEIINFAFNYYCGRDEAVQKVLYNALVEKSTKDPKYLPLFEALAEANNESETKLFSDDVLQVLQSVRFGYIDLTQLANALRSVGADPSIF